MTVTIDGTNGITSPGGDVASASLQTPVLQSASTLTFKTNGTTTAMTVDASQNVGIGGTSPSPSAGWPTLSVVAGASKAATVYLQGNGATGASGGFQLQGGSDSLAYLWNFQNTAMAFATNNTERMRIDSSGNLCVGATSALINGSNWKTVIQTTSDYNLCLNGTTAGGYATMTLGTNGGTQSSVYYSGGQSRLYVTNGSGGVYLAANGTSWTAVSDERAKENFAPITDAANKVASLRAVTGNYIYDENKTSKAFLIAQDVLKVLPEAVDISDPNELGVQYADVIPLLVAAIQELNAKVEALEAKLA